MKKIIAILLFVLPLMTLKVTAQNESIKTLTVETINSNGTGTLRDNQTGALKEYVILSNQNGMSEFTLGNVISYLAINDEGKGFGSIIRMAVQDENKGFGNIIRMAIQDEGKGFASLIR